MNSIIKKSSATFVFLILLLISLSFQPLGFSSKVNEKNDYEILGHLSTIYVDDDNIEGPWDGTLEHPYRTIIDGVDNASEGDTVFVFNGVYSHEYIYVRKSIKLIGESKYGTIIDGLWSGVEVEDNINHEIINGFELRNFMLNNTQAVYLFSCTNCVISGNIITGNSRGIYLTYTSNSIVSHNDIRVPKDNIILRANSINNIIDNNFLYGYNKILTGIVIEYYSNDTIVSNNTISNCERGIEVHLSDRAIITDNNIYNSTDYGIDFFVSSNSTISRNIIINGKNGLDTMNSDDLIISQNIIANNEIEGISLSYGKNIDVSYNTIFNNSCGVSLCFVDDSECSNNTITYSSQIGIDVMDSIEIAGNNLISYNNINNCYCGIVLDQSWRNTYKNNIINFNELGIILYGATYFNVVAKNIVENNVVGVEFYGFIQGKTYAPVSNYVVSNNVSMNSNCGIYGTVLTKFNNIYYNNLFENYQNAHDEGTNVWYKYKALGGSKGNYWDDYAGIDADGDGIGDTPYNIEPSPFRNKDRYPCMEPIDIQNTQVTSLIVSSYTSVEILQVTQQFVINNKLDVSTIPLNLD